MTLTLLEIIWRAHVLLEEMFKLANKCNSQQQLSGLICSSIGICSVGPTGSHFASQIYCIMK